MPDKWELAPQAFQGLAFGVAGIRLVWELRIAPRDEASMGEQL